MSNEYTPEQIEAMRERLMQLMGPEAAAYPHHLEKGYPRILAKLIEVWNTPELAKYVDELTFSSRAGRAGFSSDVAMDLFNLGTLHAVTSQVQGSDADGWSKGIAT
jgi:hypothetical protein